MFKAILRRLKKWRFSEPEDFDILIVGAVVLMLIIGAIICFASWIWDLLLIAFKADQ